VFSLLPLLSFVHPKCDEVTSIITEEEYDDIRQDLVDVFQTLLGILVQELEEPPQQRACRRGVRS
jgi:hypothetical protein